MAVQLRVPTGVWRGRQAEIWLLGVPTGGAAGRGCSAILVLGGLTAQLPACAHECL